ncbi:MAG TPA: mannosyltransferase family protein [Ktedonobacteraceae bacterium]|nr:mannosyltransferase family protein [Ktedonobacteraceae bacterium]
MKRAPVSDILWLFLGTRLLLFVGTYLSFILFPVPPHVYPNTPVDVIGLLTSWNHWDAERFVTIAQYGYQRIEDTPFFPLLPLLIKGIAFVCGNQGYLAIGMILSNLALLGTLFVLYYLANDALGEHVGRRTLLYLCIFPTAFFFFTAYNESLFLLLSCGTFLALRRRKWWLAGVLGLLAALTRTAGVMLILPYLYELWTDRVPPEDIQQRGRLLRQAGVLLPKALPALLLPLGTVSYCIFCWLSFGNSLAFAAVQDHWGRVTAFPWMGTVSAFVEFFYIQPFGSFIEAHLLLDMAATFGTIALTVVSWRRLRSSYALWISLLILFMLISPALNQADTLQSNQRFILEMFPAFIVLADLGLKYPRLHYACMLAFPFLQAIMATLFVFNRWMV